MAHSFAKHDLGNIYMHWYIHRSTVEIRALCNNPFAPHAAMQATPHIVVTWTAYSLDCVDITPELDRLLLGLLM